MILQRILDLGRIVHAKGEEEAVRALPVPKKGVLAGARKLPREVAKAAHDAGWRDERLVLAVAIAQAESALYEGAYNDNADGSRDRGIWQINNVAHSEWSDDACYRLDTAAVAAYSVYKGNSYTFRPWAAYTSGAYEKFLDTSITGVGNFYRVYVFGLPPH